jgi:mono/diheme cytochrome c family protein
MRSRLAVILLAPFLLAGSTCLAHAQQSPEARGEALLSQHCGMCHVVGRVGTSPHNMAPAFRTLGQRYPIESLEEALGEGLLTGHPDMPEFAFGPRDVGAIIRYLQSIQER